MTHAIFIQTLLVAWCAVGKHPSWLNFDEFINQSRVAISVLGDGKYTADEYVEMRKYADMLHAKIEEVAGLQIEFMRRG